MSHGFGRMNRALRADSGLTSHWFLLLAFLLLTAWALWAFTAQVPRYEVSDVARLEVKSAVYPIQSNITGMLVRSRLKLGEQVKAGEVLAELDSEDQRLGLQEQRAHLASLQPEIAALRAQMNSEAEGRSDDRKVLSFSKDAARAQFQEAETQAKLATDEAERARQLHAEGILSDADAQRTQAQAQSKHEAAENLRVALSRLEPELQTHERDRDVRVKQVLVEVAKLAGEAATTAATIRRLEGELERRQILAPTSGRLGECAPLRLGAHIAAGQQLGVIVPSGRLQVVAEFEPSSALGKIRSGQPATLRLQGFPWAQYGTIQASVSRVADEIRDGKVRVELAVLSSGRSRIPYQHGLPGSVEVQTERVTPAALLLRSAGQMVGAH